MTAATAVGREARATAGRQLDGGRSGRTQGRQWPHTQGLHGSLDDWKLQKYVTVDEENGAELFYHFIDSEGDPGSDPVLLWITGGDRCSALNALFFEIGPFKLVVEPYNGSLPRLRYHPYTWTKVANLLFVESPVGAGFSFSRDPRGYDVGDVSASLQLVKFLSEVLKLGSDRLLISMLRYGS
ncbi:hypothetical protein GUJ93_ZPchr0011g28226 [Zizania palustris]|uniref:Uncharacterized protein n=1 Tax=Zizania palustris TaxID=103762 RepID=A0A8J5WJ28_ZIZPA|nr:hypothetical protein GUJ93_ZPchr0011g28226 [Zizania palustris]